MYGSLDISGISLTSFNNILYKIDKKYWSILKTCLNYLDYLYPHELNDVETDKNIEEMLKQL